MSFHRGLPPASSADAQRFQPASGSAPSMTATPAPNRPLLPSKTIGLPASPEVLTPTVPRYVTPPLKSTSSPGARTAAFALPAAAASPGQCLKGVCGERPSASSAPLSKST